MFCEVAIYEKNNVKNLERFETSRTYSPSDALSCADFSELKITGIHADRFSQLLCCFCLTLCLYNLLLALLTGAFDEESGSLGLLLSDLLALDGGSVFLSKAELGERNVIQDDVEICSSIDQLTSDQQRNLKQNH